MNGPAAAHVDDRLAGFALGTLPDAEHAEVEQHLAACPHCRGELRQTEGLLASLALGEPPVAPPRGGRAALVDAVAGGGRLARFAGQVARLLRVSVEVATQALDRLDAPEAWSPLDLPGAQGLRYFVPPMDQSLAGNAIAFLRLPPGCRFPEHAHLGPEQVLIVQGGYVDEVSRVEYGPGDIHQEPAGSSHAFFAVDGPDCLCLGVVLGKIRIGDQII